MKALKPAKSKITLTYTDSGGNKFQSSIDAVGMGNPDAIMDWIMRSGIFGLGFDMDAHGEDTNESRT